MKIRQGGYTYIVLLIIVASVLFIASALSSVFYYRVVMKEREKELLFRGMEYKKAIKSYYNSSDGKKEYPERLESLVNDPRFMKKKHIRKLYNDPITGEDWQLVLDDKGRITGVVSKSRRKPLKQKGFPEKFKDFEEAESYNEWIFDGG